MFSGTGRAAAYKGVGRDTATRTPPQQGSGDVGTLTRL